MFVYLTSSLNELLSYTVTVLWSARWSHFPPDIYIIFILLRNLVVGWTELNNLSNLPLQLTNMWPQTGNREETMKGAEKTKAQMLQGPHSHILMTGRSEGFFWVWHFGQNGFFWVYERRRHFFWSRKQHRDFFGYCIFHQLKSTIIWDCNLCEKLACVTGAKRGGGGWREKGKREGSLPLSPIPLPFFPSSLSPIPYPFRRLLRRLVKSNYRHSMRI